LWLLLPVPATSKCTAVPDNRRLTYSACVAIRVDYCNAVLYGVLTHSMVLVNAAARLVVDAGKFDHVTPVLLDILY